MSDLDLLLNLGDQMFLGVRELHEGPVNRFPLVFLENL